MSYTYDQIKHKTVAELKEIASGMEHEALKGYTQLKKDKLIVALCDALGIDTFEHHHVVGVDKTKIKAKIREFKKKRDEALEAHDHKQLKFARTQIKHFKKVLRRAMV